VIGLDTNILLRWLVDESIWPDDAPHQTKLIAEMLLVPGARFYVNTIVIEETIWVLANRLKEPRRMIVDILERLLSASSIDIENRAAVGQALRSYAKGPGDFADHLIARINLGAGCEMTMTFDKAASKAPGFKRLQKER
jgi:predicted nucleic-acid-binding protein